MSTTAIFFYGHFETNIRTFARYIHFLKNIRKLKIFFLMIAICTFITGLRVILLLKYLHLYS